MRALEVDSEEYYYSHNVPISRPQRRNLKQEIMELQLRRQKSFAEKMGKYDEEIKRRDNEPEDPHKTCFLLLKLLFIFVLVCFLRTGLEFGFSEFH